MPDPREALTKIINSLDVDLDAIADPGERAAVAREVAEKGRFIDHIATERMRGAVQGLRAAGESHAQIGARFGVTRGRAQQLGGVPVLLADGPKIGTTIYPAAGKGGQPPRQLLVAVNGGALNYWRRLDPEPDGSWVAQYFEGTTAPADWTEDLDVT